MLHPLRYFCWLSSGGWGANVVGRDPICKERGDFPIISPADNKVVIVGEVSIMGRLFQREDWQTTWCCQRGRGGGRLVGFSSGWALQDPNLSIQAEYGVMFS